MITKSELLQYNTSYDFEHTLTDSDVEIANAYILAIENSRSFQYPEAGDILFCKNKKGERIMYHIDNMENWKMSLCENAYVPFTSVRFTGGHRASISLSTSGGPWSSMEFEKTKIKRHVLRKKKLFKFWGHCGPTGNGAVEIPANVNVWEVEEETKE